MSIESVKNQLIKIRGNKISCLKFARQYDGQKQAVVELEKDIAALDFAIRVLWKVERSKRHDKG